MIAAGFKFLHVARVNSDGYMIGGLELAVAGDDPQPMYRMEGAQTAPISIGENEIITVIGDDDPLVTFGFEATTLPGGVVEMANRDVDLEALAQGTKVQQLKFAKLGALQPKGGEPAGLFMLAQRRAKTWSPGSRGGKAWEALVILGANITPLFAQIQQRQHTPYRYSVTTGKVSRKPWGELFTVAENGATAMPIFTLDLDNPINIESALGDGIEDAFVLNALPLSGIDSLEVYVNGLAQVVTTDFTYAEAYGIATVTFVDPPADDDIIEFLIEVDASTLEAV